MGGSNLCVEESLKLIVNWKNRINWCQPAVRAGDKDKRLWSWPLTWAVAIAWHETSCIAGNRKTGNNCWCQQGVVAEKPSWAAVPSDFIYPKIRRNTNRMRELSVMVCTRTEGFALRNVGKEGVRAHGYFTAWWPSTAYTHHHCKTAVLKWLETMGSIFFLMTIEDEIIAYLLVPLIVMCFPTFFSIVCFGREWQHLDYLMLFSDLSLPPWDLPISPSPSLSMNFQLHTCRSNPYFLFILDQKTTAFL